MAGSAGGLANDAHQSLAEILVLVGGVQELGHSSRLRKPRHHGATKTHSKLMLEAWKHRAEADFFPLVLFWAGLAAGSYIFLTELSII